MGGVKLLASALIAFGMKLGYTAEPKFGKKQWSKMELLSNNEFLLSKCNKILWVYPSTWYLLFTYGIL